jgi:hypothetical protein
VVTRIHLLAAKLHLNVFAFFVPSTSPSKGTALDDLYNSTCSFLQLVMDYETSTGTLLENCSNFIAQTIFSAIFALLKLLNSSFASRINPEHGKALFNAAILASRRMSLQDGDLSYRVATKVPQQWKQMGEGAPWSAPTPDPLDMTIQMGMSMSHRYDCMWKQLKTSASKAQNHELNISGQTVNNTDAQTTPHVHQAETNPPLSLPADVSFTGFGMDDVDLFISMGWMMGDSPRGPWDFNG